MLSPRAIGLGGRYSQFDSQFTASSIPSADQIKEQIQTVAEDTPVWDGKKKVSQTKKT